MQNTFGIMLLSHDYQGVGRQRREAQKWNTAGLPTAGREHSSYGSSSFHGGLESVSPALRVGF